VGIISSMYSKVFVVQGQQQEIDHPEHSVSKPSEMVKA